MFGKIKKILISLALASSLALAPMNVSALTGSERNDDGKLCVSNTSTDSIQTPINVTIADSYQWTVVVPDKFSLNADNKDAQEQSTPFSQSATISIKDSVLGSKTLTVTPTLNVETAYKDYPISMEVTAGTQNNPASVSNGTVSFTASNQGAADLSVSIPSDQVNTWKSAYPGGLNDTTVANITYLIEFK